MTQKAVYFVAETRLIVLGDDKIGSRVGWWFAGSARYNSCATREGSQEHYIQIFEYQPLFPPEEFGNKAFDLIEVAHFARANNSRQIKIEARWLFVRDAGGPPSLSGLPGGEGCPAQLPYCRLSGSYDPSGANVRVRRHPPMNPRNRLSRKTESTLQRDHASSAY
jgi:hypothetical protein